MIVVSLSDCPPKLRGDLTRWLAEINTGVYVGNASARVRDALWQRICENLAHGRATMVYSARNEQGLCFRAHNTTWQPTDFDGVTLMKRPPSVADAQDPADSPKDVSDAARFLNARRRQASQVGRQAGAAYCVVDVETTGLSSEEHEIIEIAALRVAEDGSAEELSMLVKPGAPVPKAVTRLTGITDQMLDAEGVPLAEAMNRFLAFVGKTRCVFHHATFDMAFLRTACARVGLRPFANPYTDTLALARRRVEGLTDYKLQTLSDYFGLPDETRHRSLGDCRTTKRLLEKLNEIPASENL